RDADRPGGVPGPLPRPRAGSFSQVSYQRGLEFTPTLVVGPAAPRRKKKRATCRGEAGGRGGDADRGVTGGRPAVAPGLGWPEVGGTCGREGALARSLGGSAGSLLSNEGAVRARPFHTGDQHKLLRDCRFLRMLMGEPPADARAAL